MKKYIFRFGIMLLFTFISSSLSAQKIPILNFERLTPYLHRSNDTTYVVNFWASWCIPCVKEMPVFNELHKKYGREKVKIILVSLDFPQHVKTRLLPFIEKHKVMPEVVLLDEPDGNKWIDKVSPEWSGAIPATLIYNKNTRDFFEKIFSFTELETIIKSKL